MEDIGPAAMLGRMTIDKQFRGELEGTSQGQMLTAGAVSSGSAVYVAVERVSARLAGKQGTFALYHVGVVDRAQPSLSIRIVPGSGTDGLTGISGTLDVRVENGAHAYVLEYAFG
jgi:hypothetical protein